MRLAAELHPRHVDTTVIRTHRALVYIYGLVIRELPVRALGFPIAIPDGNLGELLTPAVEPGPAAVGGTADQKRDLVRGSEVECLADVIGGAVGTKRDAGIASGIVETRTR